MRAYYRALWREIRALVWNELRSQTYPVVAAVVLALIGPLAFGILASPSQKGLVDKLQVELPANAWYSAALLGIVIVVLLVPAVLQAPVRLDQNRQNDLVNLAGDLDRATEAIAAHVERLRPKLRFHFAGRHDPYYYEYTIHDNHGNDVFQRGFRVAVLNESTSDIEDVQVLLRDASNKTGSVYVDHHLTFMGHGDEKTVTARPGAKPSLYANIVAQNVDPNFDRHTEFFYYAESQLIGQIGQVNQMIELVVQGGGGEDEISFTMSLGSDGALQLIAMPKPFGG